MKWFMIVAIVIGLSGCGHVNPDIYEKAVTVCAPNDGLKKLRVSQLILNVATCNNGATFKGKDIK